MSLKITTDSNLTASKIDQIIPLPLIKRLFDFSLAAIVLILLSPLIFLIYLALKIEGYFRPDCRGSFFYVETRISQGQPFRFYKIRIFKPTALQKTLRESGFIHTKPLEMSPQNLTAAGKFLKKFYLDELGQLLNIIKGEMSFVGTRPWNTVDYPNEIARGIYRKKVLKAGLTGLVQITKGEHYLYPGGDRGLDDYYIHFCRTHSAGAIFLFDLKILGWSIIKLLKGQGL